MDKITLLSPTLKGGNFRSFVLVSLYGKFLLKIIYFEYSSSDFRVEGCELGHLGLVELG